MPAIHRVLFPLAAAFAVAGGTVACSDPNELGNATDPNVVDTVTLGALEGTEVHVPSAFSIRTGGAVRVDQTIDFDFAFNIDDAEQPVFIPLAALDIPIGGLKPGLQRDERPFAEIVEARSNGYTTDSLIVFAVGERYLMRSRAFCSSGVPQYGKLEVLSIEGRFVTFQLLVNNNCGFRGLKPGIPEE